MYRQNTLSTISGTVGTISSFVGSIFFFININVTIICALILIVDSFIQVIFGEQNNLTTEVLTVIVAIIVALIIDANILHTIVFAMCIVTAVFSILGWVLMLISYKRRF